MHGHIFGFLKCLEIYMEAIMSGRDSKVKVYAYPITRCLGD